MRTGGSSTVPVVIAIGVALAAIGASIYMYSGELVEAKKALATQKTETEKLQKSLNESSTASKALATELAGPNSKLADALAVAREWRTNLAKDEAMGDNNDPESTREILDAFIAHRDFLKKELGLERRARKDDQRAHEATEGELTRQLREIENTMQSEIKSLRVGIKVVTEEIDDQSSTFKKNERVRLKRTRSLISQLTATKQELRATKDKVKVLILKIEGSQAKELAGGQEVVVTNKKAFRSDGSIIKVDAKKAVINIGADDGVKKGMVFIVYYMEGNLPIGKSMAVVRKADPGIPVSMVELYPLNKENIMESGTISDMPVVSGDLVSNPFFLRGRQPRFFLDGEFVTHNEWGVVTDRTDVERKIAEYGGTVVNEITVETDFVVLGMNYKKSEMEKAKQFGSTIISKADIMDFLDSGE